ncbi:general transcription factor IIH subunit 2-like [Nematolebias whitei]|uniref:general transcription factor IIH subunit 2-like n=1 Tax=Nematolebias whitei TaxID=451745 RepID=UPI001899A6E7|nr:general transcription factor IIH subunit 2-like [Nematolebias whitei]
MSHLDSSSNPDLSLRGYFCPQCHAKYTELPVECKVCGLTLVSAPHLARSFHHLFPLKDFVESPVEDLQGNRFCQTCQMELIERSLCWSHTVLSPGAKTGRRHLPGSELSW